MLGLFFKYTLLNMHLFHCNLKSISTAYKNRILLLSNMIPDMISSLIPYLR